MKVTKPKCLENKGRTLRLAVTYTFGKSDSCEYNRHNHIDTGGYGEEHHH